MLPKSGLAFKKLAFLFVLLPVLLSINGCSLFGKENVVDANDKSLSVIFGYFDMKDAPSWGGIDWVSVKQFKPKVAYYSCGVEDGLFWHIGASNGSIQVDSFGRNTRWYSNAAYTYDFGGQGRNDTSTIIKKPGVYFLGSYKFKPIDSGSIFKADKFDMKKMKTPSEKELLTRMLKMMQTDSDFTMYTHQIGMIKRRLAQLDTEGR